MKKGIKLIVTLICVVSMVAMFALNSAAAAVDRPSVEIQWENTDTVDVAIGFYNGQGTADSLVRGQFGTTTIQTDIYVYRQSGDIWKYVTEMHDTKNSMISGVSCPFGITLGTNYRVDYTFIVFRDGTYEIVTRTAYRAYLVPEFIET